MSGKIWQIVCAPDGAHCFYVNSGNVLQDHLITEMPFVLYCLCVCVCVCLGGWVDACINCNQWLCLTYSL